MAFRCGWIGRNCTGRGNGAPVGWPVRCTSNSGLMSSGRAGCPIRARARVLGAARAKAPSAWRLVDIAIDPKEAAFSYQLNRGKLRQVRRREGRYLLCTNLSGKDPAQLWKFYIQLVEIEAAFKTLKDDLGLRPIYHQLEQRIEAHIFIAFLAPASAAHHRSRPHRRAQPPDVVETFRPEAPFSGASHPLIGPS